MWSLNCSPTYYQVRIVCFESNIGWIDKVNGSLVRSLLYRCKIVLWKWIIIYLTCPEETSMVGRNLCRTAEPNHLMKAVCFSTAILAACVPWLWAVIGADLTVLSFLVLVLICHPASYDADILNSSWPTTLSAYASSGHASSGIGFVLPLALLLSVALFNLLLNIVIRFQISRFRLWRSHNLICITVSISFATVSLASHVP